MQQVIVPMPHAIQVRIHLPGSKSMTNRALLLAALSHGVSEISELLLSDDTWACIHALRAVGVAISVNEKELSCLVIGCQGKFPQHKATVSCHDAGTVARFMLAICAAMPGEFYFEGSEQLSKRPLKHLTQALIAMGAQFSPSTPEHLPLTLYGNSVLQGGKIEIKGNVSSQFLSALLMVAPYTHTPLTVYTQQLINRPFVDMTCAMMAEFGVLVRRLTPNRFVVPVPQQYKALDYVIEPDLTLAANFFAAAAITTGTVTIQPIHLAQSKQGDIQFLLILKKMGCHIIESPEGLTVKGGTELQGINVDMGDFSDTFMALAAIAPFAKTPTTITNIGHTRLHESDRILAMSSELKKLNIRVEEGPDWIRIYPGLPVKGTVHSHGDHRIAMAFAIIGLRCEVNIQDADCVKKTCPEFFALWKKLYVKENIIEI